MRGRVLVLGLALVLTAQAAPVVRSLGQRLPGRTGQVVRLTHRYGDIVARPAPSDTLLVTATARVEGKNRQQVAAFVAGIELSIAEWADTVFVAVLYPELIERSGEFSYDVNIRLEIPDGVRLDATGSFGDVDVRGVTGGSSVSNRYGDVRFRDCRDIDVTVKHGDVRVEESTGRLGINCTYGNVYLDGVTDRVDVDSRYGDVTGQQLAGEVNINNVLGSIDTDGGRGRWCLTSRCGQVAARFDDSALTNLDVIAELARVRLLLPQLLPFRIDGQTRPGDIGTPYPLQTSARGDQRRVSGVQGKGGPNIVFTGAWSDFYIGPDTVGGGRSAEDSGR